MFRKLTYILLIALLSSAVWAVQPYHEVKIVDETGAIVTTITSVSIYAPDSTTDAVIYMDRGEQNTITIPMTPTSDNTTLVDGVMSWYGPDGYNFSITDGSNIANNADHRPRTSSEGRLIFPSYLTAISSTTYSDAQSATFGDGGDWVLRGGNVANQMSFTPIADNSNFIIGVSGTSLNSSFNVYVGTALGLKLDASVPSLTWDGGAVLVNHNSNFNVGINTGTSTGNSSIGSGTSGTVALDTDAGMTINADDSIAMTVSAGTIGIAATGGDITIDGTNSSVIVRGTEAIADAIWIDADAGGVDITAAATFDIDITATGGKILMNATEDAAGAISAIVNGGTSETIVLTNTQGTGTDSFNIDATAGGIDIDAELEVAINVAAAASNLVLGSTLGSIYIEAEEDVANAILITADGGTSTTLEIFNDTGTSATEGAASIQLLSDVGAIALQSGLDGAAITLLADAGTSEVILINADQGTGVGSITLDSDDGGITINTGTGADDGINYNGRTDSLIVLEGTADAFETSLTFTDPSADGTINFPDTADEGAAGGDVAWVADAGTANKDASDAAIPVTDAVVLGTSGAASAWSLPNGEEGQILTVQIVTDGGEAIITPDTCAGCGWATAVLTDDIDGITFLYVDDTVGWMVIGTSGDGTNLVALTQ